MAAPRTLASSLLLLAAALRTRRGRRLLAPRLKELRPLRPLRRPLGPWGGHELAVNWGQIDVDPPFSDIWYTMIYIPQMPRAETFMNISRNFLGLLNRLKHHFIVEVTVTSEPWRRRRERFWISRLDGWSGSALDGGLGVPHTPFEGWRVASRPISVRKWTVGVEFDLLTKVSFVETTCSPWWSRTVGQGHAFGHGNRPISMWPSSRNCSNAESPELLQEQRGTYDILRTVRTEVIWSIPCLSRGEPGRWFLCCGPWMFFDQ